MYFFLSYARSDDDAYVARFYRDLCSEVRVRAGLPSAQEVGFFDTESIEIGAAWSARLVTALSTCRTFVALCSPRYFVSEPCGREWRIFSDRQQRQGQHTGQQSAIMPVLWLPPRRMPAVVERLQYSAAALGEAYQREGLRQLMRLRRQACVRSALGDDLAARTVAQGTYDGFRSVLGDNHLFTLACASNLAVFARRLGDHPFATRLAEQVTAELDTAAGTTHPYRLASAANLATCRFVAGEYAEARDLDERVYAGMSERFGADHPDALVTGGNLATSRRATGDPVGAEALLDDVLTRAGRVLGDAHPDTVALHAGLRLDCYVDPPAP